MNDGVDQEFNEGGTMIWLTSLGTVLISVVAMGPTPKTQEIILVQAQGVQDPSLHPGFWSITNDSPRDLVRVELDLPGPSRQFDELFGVIVDSVIGADPDDIAFSFPGDNGDNLRVDFAPGSFMSGAEIRFYADVDMWVNEAVNMVGISANLSFVDGPLQGDTFQNVDLSPLFDFGPEGSGAAFEPFCGPADLAQPFRVLDFSDVIAFLSSFGAGDAEADLAVPFGTFDFSDVIVFLQTFAAGCP